MAKPIIKVFDNTLIPFSFGLYLTLVGICFYPTPFYPLDYTQITLLVLALLVFIYFRKPLISGILLGVVTMSLQVQPSVSAGKTFEHCSFSFSIEHITTRNLKLNAQHVQCNELNLGQQTLTYWLGKDALKLDSTQRYVATGELIKKSPRFNIDSFDTEKHQFLTRQSFTVKDLQITQSLTPTKRDALRHHINRQLSQYLGKYSAITQALITGTRYKLSYQEKALLQRSGTGHILAISGLHIGIVALWAMFIGQTFWAMSSRLSAYIAPMQFTCVFAFFSISAYAWLTGFSLPTQRAWLMLSVILLSRLLFYHFSVQSILLALLAVLLIQPLSVLSVGFYLSFIATFIVQHIYTKPWSGLVKIFAIQGCISLILLPISWYTFGQVSTVGFVANLLLLPWLSFVVMPTLFLTVLINQVVQIDWLWSLSYWSLDALWLSLTKLDQWLNINIEWTQWQRPTLLITAISVISMLGSLTYRTKYIILGLTPLLMTFIPSSTKPSILIADAPFLSVLIHDGYTATIINPGYRKNSIDDSHKWLAYLARHDLQLTNIILTDTNVKRASATSTLLTHYPNAHVILGLNKPFIGNAKFCHSASTNLNTKRVQNHCQFTLSWQNKQIKLYRNKLMLDEKALDTRGPVIFAENNIHHLNNPSRIWRTKAK